MGYIRSQKCFTSKGKYIYISIKMFKYFDFFLLNYLFTISEELIKAINDDIAITEQQLQQPDMNTFKEIFLKNISTSKWKKF